MILGLLRALYFFGPVMALGLIAYIARPTIGWTLWFIAALIVSAHWISYFSAKEDGAAEIEFLSVAVWSPLIATTLLAWLVRSTWLNQFESRATAQGVVAGLCVLPSIAALIFFW